MRFLEGWVLCFILVSYHFYVWGIFTISFSGHLEFHKFNFLVKYQDLVELTKLHFLVELNLTFLHFLVKTGGI